MDENKKAPARLEPERLERPKKPPTYTRVNRQGMLEIIDLTTGRVLCVQREAGDDFIRGKFENLISLNTPQGVVWLDRSIDPSKVDLASKTPYSLAWGDLIAEQMVGGSSLSQACATLQLPYSTVCRWRREFPEFREILDYARKDRAESFHDEVIDTARAQEKGDKHAKIHIEALKWAAEKGDPDKFGARTKVVGDPDAPVAFMIDTGIRRRGDVGFQGVPLPDHVEGLSDSNENSGEHSSNHANLQSDVIDVTEPPENFEGTRPLHGESEVNDGTNQETLAAGHEVQPLDEDVSAPDFEHLPTVPTADKQNE